MADAADEKHAADARVVYLRRCVCSSLKCKDDKVDRLLVNEDSSAAITAFLDSNELNRLLVYDAGKGELAAVRRGARRETCLLVGLFDQPPAASCVPLPPAARVSRRTCALCSARAAAQRPRGRPRALWRVRCAYPKTLLPPCRAPCLSPS